jgi:hypothetical protein
LIDAAHAAGAHRVGIVTERVLEISRRRAASRRPQPRIEMSIPRPECKKTDDEDAPTQ